MVNGIANMYVSNRMKEIFQMEGYMTVQELYDWAKERGLLDKPIAKHFNFNIEDVETVIYLTEEMLIGEAKVVVD